MIKRVIVFGLSIIVSNILLAQLENVRSTLEVFDLTESKREVIYQEDDHFEAPNWSPDGSYLLLNGRGRIFKLGLKSKQKTYIETGFADKLNNDHGISPDGKTMVISHYDQPGVSYGNRDFRRSRIYTLPISGGLPEAVTKNTPSFWHGWSPNGRNLVYTALRKDNFDIYSISVNGGKETRLTTSEGLDDGPDYSHDGRYIYFNSMQSGKMEIWRMEADGTDPVQITDDTYSNWFPHPSPNGRYVVFLSYLEDQGSAHPALKKVALRLLDLDDNSVKTLCYFTGGQGSINVPSWSPDGEKFAFVSYEYLHRPSFNAEYIYAFIDSDMPATGYIDGNIKTKYNHTGDRMVILRRNNESLEAINTVPVSNSVRRWPNSVSTQTIDERKFLLVAEQDGQAPAGASNIQEIPKAELLTLVEVTAPESAQVLDSMIFEHIPTCVAFHPDSNLFALTFIGSNEILIGKISNGKIEALAKSQVTLPNEAVKAIPHFTWHPSGNFAGISLAGNDKLVFLSFDDKSKQLTPWGNVLKTPPLPGVGQFTQDGQFYIQTVINLMGDLEQDAYKDNSSLLQIYRFDDDIIPNSPPTRSNDGNGIYNSPTIKHTVTQNVSFGNGYVETFAISPDNRYIVGLNMRGSWLPKDRLGHTQHASLELFELEDGKTIHIGSYPFQGVLPERILFDETGKNILVTNFHNTSNDQNGSLLFWQLETRDGRALLTQSGHISLPGGVHYVIAE